MTKLTIVRTLDLLVVLKNNKCWSDKHPEQTGCDRATHTYNTIAGLHLLQPDELSWCLEQSWIKR